MGRDEGHWAGHAPQWDLVASPLRPCAADVVVFERLLREVQARDVLLLGMTPELARLPDPVRLVAVDRAAAMIARLWQTPRPGRAAICADWQALPLRDAAFDAVLGDGALNMLEGKAALAAFAAEVLRVLRPGGTLLLRVFTRPDDPETPEAVLAALRGGRIGSFHAFKWRLAMALHGSLERGVRLADIWHCWNEAVPAPRALLAERGWDERLAGTIDVYRGVQTRYCFPRRGEIKTIFAGRFREVGYEVQRYELAERCPIVALQALN